MGIWAICGQDLGKIWAELPYSLFIANTRGVKKRPL